ncbi:MAG: O-antigen ligase family protein [Bacillota bacterium]
MAPKGSNKNKKRKKPTDKVKQKQKKQDSSRNIQSLNYWAEKIIPFVMLLALALLLFIGPFQRGLFFPRELLIAKIFIFGLLIIWGYFRLIKKDGRLIETPLDICLIVLLFAYGISFFFAVNTRDALGEALKVAAYLVVFLLTLDICRYLSLPRIKLNRGEVNNSTQPKSNDSSSDLVPPGINLILHLLLVAAGAVTIASLGVPAGHWNFPGAYASARIASPMGYANTAAAYLMAAYFLALALAPLAKKWWKVLYLAPAATMLFAVILTFSRGAWLLLVPLSLLLIVIAAPGERLRSFLYLLVTALAAVPTALIADQVFRSDTPAQAWLLVAAALVFAIILGLFVELYLSQSRKLRIAVAGGAGAAVFAAFFIIFILPALGPIQLERGPDQDPETRTVEQLIRGISPEKDYRLSLDINAEKDPASDEEIDYVWRLRILGGLPGDRDEELLDYKGSATDGWEERDFNFETKAEMDRLEVKIYNHYPGTSVTARNVALSAEGMDRSLRFTLNRMLPDRFYDRLFSFSLERNLDARVEFMEDAVQIIGDHPVLGTGGGGWNAIYRAYQDRPYNTTEVHNHFLQVWLEAGLLGFLAFLGLWVSTAVSFVRNCAKKKAPSRVWQFWTAAFIPIAALGAHSMIDWNFSMAAVGIFLFVLLGASRSLDRVNWFERKNCNRKINSSRGRFVGIGGIIIGVCLFIFSLMLLDGLYATWRSQELVEQNRLKQAREEMRRGIQRDPFRTDNYYNLSVLIEDHARRAGMQADMDEVISFAERAYELEPYNPRYVSHYGNLLLHNVDVNEGLEMIDRLMYLRPFSESSYLQAISSRLQLADFYLGEGEQAEAERHLNDILEIESKMEEHLDEIKPFAFHLGRTYFLLGEYSVAEDYLMKVEEGDDLYEQAQEHLEMIKDVK